MLNNQIKATSRGFCSINSPAFIPLSSLSATPPVYLPLCPCWHLRVVNALKHSLSNWLRCLLTFIWAGAEADAANGHGVRDAGGGGEWRWIACDSIDILVIQIGNKRAAQFKAHKTRQNVNWLQPARGTRGWREQGSCLRADGRQINLTKRKNV